MYLLDNMHAYCFGSSRARASERSLTSDGTPSDTWPVDLDKVETRSQEASLENYCPRPAKLLIDILLLADDIARSSYTQAPTGLQQKLDILQTCPRTGILSLELQSSMADTSPPPLWACTGMEDWDNSWA